MKILNAYLTAVIWLLSLPAIAQHSYPSAKITADSAWIRLNSVFGKGTDDFAMSQAMCLKYRDEGLKFWKMFPNDSRRYKWLYATVQSPVLYWKINNGDTSYKENLFKRFGPPQSSYSWPVDKKKLQEWNKVYPQLRKEFLSYFAKNPPLNPPLVSSGGQKIDPILLIGQELFGFLDISLNKQYRGEKLDLRKLRDLFTSSSAYLIHEDPNNPTKVAARIFNPMDASFIARYKEYGLTEGDMEVFFNSVKKSNSPTIRNWAIQRSSLFSLMKDPIAFRHPSLDGQIIDLDKMRGKVVLLDFWATTCSSCIERMPAIKAIYDKYKNQGFEVISACWNYGDQREDILKIEKKIGSDWPILMIGGKEVTDSKNSLGAQIFKKYGFWGVPQLLLLDKSGRLVMLNDKLRNGDFEPDVQRLLAENYKSN